MCDRYGPPDLLRLADVERPVPKDDESSTRISMMGAQSSSTALRDVQAPTSERAARFGRWPTW